MSGTGGGGGGASSSSNINEVPLREIAKQAFVEMAPQLRKAVLFLDRPSMDAILWNIGFEFLLGLGVENVLPLPPPADLFFSVEGDHNNDENASRVSKRQRFGSKAVFFVCALTEMIEEQIRALVRVSSFKQVTIFTMLPTDVNLASVSTLNANEDRGMEEDEEEAADQQPDSPFLKRMNDLVNFDIDSVAVEIEQQKISYSAFINSTFFLPATHSFFPSLLLLSSDTNEKNEDSEEETSIAAHCLSSVLSLVHQTNGNNLDVFSIGSTSKALAKRLIAVISNRLKKHNQPSNSNANQTSHHFPLSDAPATILLIDRTVDLVGAMSHGDNLLDQMNELLSERNPHETPSSLTCDIKVSLKTLDAIEQRKVPSKYQRVGSVMHASDKGGIALMDAFALRKSKEALLFLRKTLADICLSSKLPLDFSQQMGSVTANQIRLLLKTLTSNNKVRYEHKANVELAVCAYDTLSALKMSHWSQLASLEKELLVSSSNSADMASQLIRSLGAPLLGTDQTMDATEMITLVVYMYGLADKTINIGIQAELINVLVDQTFNYYSRNQNSAKLSVFEDWLEVNDIRKKALSGDISENDRLQIKQNLVEKYSALIKVLNSISQKRNDLTYLSKGVEKKETTIYKSVLTRLFELIADDKVTDLSPDVAHHSLSSSSAISSLINLGFSKFGFGGLSAMSNRNVKPNKSSGLFVIFVVGGITAQDVKDVKDALLSKKIQGKVVIGSTRLANSVSISEKIIQMT